jgi:hypothetical protein
LESAELQAVKDEIGQLGTRLDNVEGYFQNFDTTLNNHMNDYKKRQDEVVAEQAKLRELITNAAIAVAKIQGSEGLAVTLIKWVITPLIIILAGLIGLKLLIPGLSI